MFPFVLYFLTGAMTCLQIFASMMWVVWGAPLSAIQLISLFGALTLVGASLLSVFKPIRAHVIALTGILAEWIFYLPTIVSESLKNKLTYEHLEVFSPIILLTLATFYSSIAVLIDLKKIKVQVPGWLFPESDN